MRRINHEVHFAWQAQYLVKVEGDSCCSAHSKWRFICEADQSWDSFGVAGALFGEFRRLTLLAMRILNDVSYVTRINHEIHFAWQAQYLVRLEVDFASSAHSKWRFICEADQSWGSFCVAGAVFGEVRGWLCILRAFKSVDMTATSLVRDITWHDTSQLTTFNVHHVTSQTTRLLHLTPQPTSWHQNRSNHHHGTSPPWNSRRLVHSKEMVCASRWSVALRAFYRQILSLLYTTFFFWNFRPRLARELLVYKSTFRG